MASVKSLPYGIFLFRYNDEVNVVCHKAVRQHTQRKASGMFSEEMQIFASVGMIAEYFQAPNATLGHVMGCAGYNEPSCSSHGLLKMDKWAKHYGLSWAGQFSYRTRSDSWQPQLSGASLYLSCIYLCIANYGIRLEILKLVTRFHGKAHIGALFSYSRVQVRRTALEGFAKM